MKMMGVDGNHDGDDKDYYGVFRMTMMMIMTMKKLMI